MGAIPRPGEGRFARRRELSGRERLVLESLARGRSTEQVASDLHLSPHTIRTYIRSAMAKLQAHTRTHAVALALTHGQIDAPVDAAGER